MNEEQLIYGLMDVAVEQQKSIEKAINNLNTKAAAVPDDMRQVIRAEISASLSEFQKTADEADKKLKNASERITWRLTAYLVGACCGVVLMFVLIVQAVSYFNTAELEALKTEIAEAREAAESLRINGVKLKWSVCGEQGKQGKPCLRVDDRFKYGVDGEVYLVPK